MILPLLIWSFDYDHCVDTYPIYSVIGLFSHFQNNQENIGLSLKTEQDFGIIFEVQNPS